MKSIYIEFEYEKDNFFIIKLITSYGSHYVV